MDTASSRAPLTVPLNDCRRQSVVLAGELEEAARRVIAGGWYVHGREHDAFEREWAAYCGRGHCIGVANGTDALELSLRALGCGPGDEVITVANAGGYTTAATLAVGAAPVLIDVERHTLTMSPERAAAAIGPRTKAIVLTHLYGYLGPVEALCKLATERGVALVEDCAQAHGAMRGGRRAGSFGALAAFSFYPTKNLGALGDAGAIVTDDAGLAARLRALRQYGWETQYRVIERGGRNSRLDELQAAFLRCKLPHLDGWNARRRAIVDRYCEATKGGSLRIVHAPADNYVAHLCVARHPNRDEARRRIKSFGVSTAIHYPLADHQQPAFQAAIRRPVELPVTDRAQAEILTLPCFAEMTAEEIDAVCAAIRAVG